MNNKIISVILLILLAAGAGFGGGYYSFYVQEKQADAPIVVLNVKQIVEDAVTGPKGNLEPNNVAEGYKRVRRIAEKFAQNGYLVLDRKDVLAAPPQYYVDDHPGAQQGQSKGTVKSGK